jgi:2-oxo-3-hexenedioate decarboxylase
MTTDPDQRARQIAEALAAPRQIAPLVWDDPAGLTDAHAVAARLRAMQGRRRVGCKVGFTNRGIWPLYGVDRPIWGEIQQETLLPAGQPVALAPFSEPRIEPEIVLGLGRRPLPGMSRAELLACIEWVAPGFEIVQSIYPGWRFSVADAIAAQALHGGLLLGDRLAASAERLKGLPDVTVALSCDGQTRAAGAGRNALDGPLEVLAHLVELLGPEDALEAGEMVTTGTLTDAFPVAPGESWSAHYGGSLEATLSVRFT